MKSVTVKKSVLLAKVRKNRTAHRAEFIEAEKGYRSAVRTELENMMAELMRGDKVRRVITLPEPVDHTADYDRVIAMLEMSTEAKVELHAHEFEQYVLDNWQWKESAKAVFANYTSSV